MTLPEEFKKEMIHILGSDYPDFESSMHERTPVSIRMNPAKPQHELTVARQIPWCPEGYYLKERPLFTMDPFFHAGHYYVQEASSMFLDFILKSLDLKSEPLILDLCSAPGGKSTILLSHLRSRGLVHCHEYDSYRHGILKQTLVKWGYPNSIVTYGSLHQLQKLSIKYDLILIDAPCSGEGMFRKEKEAIKQWNLSKVNYCHNLQRTIFSVADSLCANHGYIIYSTCTWNSKENEEIVSSYVQSGKYQSVKIHHEFPILETANPAYTYRFFPHKLEGEGYTISVLKKQDESVSPSTELSSIKFSESDIDLSDWLMDYSEMTVIPFKDNNYAIHKKHVPQVMNIQRNVNTSYFGIPLGVYKAKDFYPSHGLCQSILALQELESVNYLRALTPELVVQTKTIWLTGKYKSATLGWIKVLNNRLKNYLPKNLRIISY
jgi:16S rRNA C967 or C1407 C5-methylase (RsmB/RsmF family)/NOL1/NOP2/fmu family ribosome biogenesis protein